MSSNIALPCNTALMQYNTDSHFLIAILLIAVGSYSSHVPFKSLLAQHS